MDNEKRNPLEDEIAANAAKKVRLEAEIASLESIISELERKFARITDPDERQQAETELEKVKRGAALLRTDLESINSSPY